MEERYTLDWHTFTEHLQLMFKDLYQEGRYADITLVSDDQTQFKAHKIVLSACSPVFKKIIDSNPSQHPLIYLRGIQSYEMESILQFMYLGEGKFYKERKGEFIKVAQNLEVKEISKVVELLREEEDIIEDNNSEDDMEETLLEERESQAQKPKQRRARSQISSDTKSTTKCRGCDAVFTRKDHMVTHYRSKHEGLKYPCNQCDYKATRMDILQVHIKSLHEGVKYPCNQCSFKATTQRSLQIHFQSKHEGIRYPCNECGYQATQLVNLQRHIKSVHKSYK